MPFQFRCYLHPAKPSFRLFRRQLSSLSFPENTNVIFLSGLLPEPNASAAGVRTKSLLKQLAQTDGVRAIHYGTGSKPKQESASQTTQREIEKTMGVQFHHVLPNNSEAMKAFLQQATTTSPNNNNIESVLVILDRFYAEEAYSFHIHQQLPNAAIVLDMQDMHSLRRHRQSMIQSIPEKEEADPLSDLPISKFPAANDSNLQRELASIYRSDLTLVCSPAERKILTNIYHVPQEKLCLASFFVDTVDSQPPLKPSFQGRKDFVFIGGFRHEPNIDAVRQMKRLWPHIRDGIQQKTADKPKFHVYGPFCPRSLRIECHDPEAGFLVRGFANEPVDQILSQHRALLAPLRFGAGIKGKIVDAWNAGTPVITTSIGSEGMDDEGLDFGGVIAESAEEFIHASINLYIDEKSWSQKQEMGRGLVANLYGIQNWTHVGSSLISTLCNVEQRRQSDFLRGVLWHQSLRSTEYFSRWIEHKERKDD